MESAEPSIRARFDGLHATVPKTVPTRLLKTWRFPQYFDAGGSRKTVASRIV